MIDETDYMNYEQAAAYLVVHRSRIYELAKAGRIGRRFLGRLVFTREELDEYKKQKEERPKGGRLKKAHSVPARS